MQCELQLFQASCFKFRGALKAGCGGHQWVLNSYRIFIMSSALQGSACGFFPNASPLLKKERDIGITALFAHGENPFFTHWTCSGATLSTNDYPSDAIEVESTQIFQKGFNREKANGCRRSLQICNSSQAVLSVFNRNPPPYVSFPGCFLKRAGKQFTQAV